MTCLDLFCGTGSFGLEFLSRGGKKCTFVDTDIKVIKENVTLLKLNNNFKIIRNDAVKYISACKGDEYNIGFADPPYKYTRYNDLLKGISKLNITFILEHDKSYTVSDEFADNLILQKKIGFSFFSFFDFKKII
jgi:16S rRNA (guanine(966)-N(2))-methyltransferase RsmD